VSYKMALVLTAVALVLAVPATGGDFIVGDAQIGWISTLQPPDYNCEGGEPTGLPMPPCSEDTRHITTRNEVQLWAPATMSPSVQPWIDGTITFRIQCSFDPAYRGPCSGTFDWEVPGMGTWSGTWTAPVMDLVTYESQFSMVGLGSGGETTRDSNLS
jgi:hypothetical protein